MKKGIESLEDAIKVDFKIIVQFLTFSHHFKIVTIKADGQEEDHLDIK